MQQRKVELVSLRASTRELEVISRAAEDAGMSRSEFIRLAAIRAATAKADLHLWQEIAIMPMGDRTLEDSMAWLMARYPRVRDLVNGEGHLDGRVRRALREVLSPVQASRIERRFRGQQLEQIAAQDGCSKQAVHATIERGLRVLVGSEMFKQVLQDFVRERHVEWMEA